MYSTVFEQLAKQEQEAFDENASKVSSLPTYPFFGMQICSRVLRAQGLARLLWQQLTMPDLLSGTSKASAKEVTDFYAFWQHFVSDQTFDWADQYNLAAAPNRPVSAAETDCILPPCAEHSWA